MLKVQTRTANPLFSHTHVAILLFWVFVAIPLWAAEDYTKSLQAFEEYAKQHMQQDQMPGMVIGFIKDDYVWIKPFGLADLENKVAANENSAYRLGSVSKPLTAIAILQLAQAGKINLDAEVQTYVPYFPKKQWAITVRQLLGHLGGISHYKNYDQEGHIKEHKNTREAIAIFENFDLVAEPGTKYSYSSYGYNLLGAVIEGASGESYGDYMRKHVWGPAAMNHTRLDDPNDLIPNRVRGYRIIDGQVKNSEAIDISSRFGAGGTRSTVPDLLNFAKALMDGKLVSPQSFDSMTSSMATKDGHLTDYGMGWDVERMNGHFAIAHTGGQQETRTVLYIFPRMRFAIAGATNFEDTSPVMYARHLYELLFREQLDLSIYSNEHNTALLNQTVQSIYDSGASYYDKYRKPLAANSKETEQAFAYFNSMISLGPEEIAKRTAQGRHPVSGQLFVKMGSYMASAMQKSDSDPLTFFTDYIAVYKKDEKIPKQLRFSSSFEKKIADWKSAWQKTNSESIRNISLTADSNYEEIGRTLKGTFAGAAIYPDFTGQLTESVRQLVGKGEMEKATKVSELSSELYPQSDTSLTTLAIIRILEGNKQQASSLLQKASTISKVGLAGPDQLNSVAYELAGLGHVNEALTLLQIATELYPTVANLYDSMGEFYLKSEQKDQAVASFRKALELDPSLKHSQQELEKLTK